MHVIYVIYTEVVCKITKIKLNLGVLSFLIFVILPLKFMLKICSLGKQKPCTHFIDV